MIDQINETVEIDVCGQICPSSLLTALREVNNYKDPLRSGLLKLEILTDNHDSTNRICDAVVNMGYRVVVEDQKNQYRICIAKMDGKKSL
ncbi:MAG: sulfurtransferase TusA family protein [Desulfuromusa sp.]|jgi:TusA-related sulfurtransferase|nr:sulfurtransferase TusA family protein [Desulfuromusa sp.]